VNRRIGAVIPVSGIAQGAVFQVAFPGLMSGRFIYTPRHRRELSVSLSGAAFWRTDLETLRDAELDAGSKERYLGAELSGSLVWALQSALRLTAGGGAFFPGGAFTKDAKMRWKASGGVTLSM
jgi:hypothetical protein